MGPRGRPSRARPAVHQSVRLRGAPALEGKAKREFENSSALGGMRKPASSVNGIAGSGPVGPRLRAALERHLESHPDVEDTVLGILRDTPVKEAPTGLAGKALKELRTGVRRVFKERGAPPGTQAGQSIRPQVRQHPRLLPGHGRPRRVPRGSAGRGRSPRSAPPGPDHGRLPGLG